jgi:hypothetical protein
MISTVTGALVHIVETRAGAYLNLATPLAFYGLATTMFGPTVALAALAAFLFFQPFSSWESATYSPWLLVSNFAQAFFYVTLAAWIKHVTRPRTTTALATGVLLGVTLLAHTAPASLLGLVMAITTVGMAIRRCTLRVSLARIVALSFVIIIVALVVATPVWLTILHYGGHIRNPLPFLWLDPAMEPSNVRSFIWLNVRRYLLNTGIAVGLVGLIRPIRQPARVAVLAWYFGSLALFAWSAYAWRLIDVELLTRLAIAPAHHFLLYFRAAEALLFGLGVVSLVQRATDRWVRGQLVMANVVVVAVLVAVHVPSYFQREDFSTYPHEAAATFTDRDLHSTVNWIAGNTGVLDVFLSPEDAALSLVGAMGRKSVIVERFFSNPYLDWYQRNEARNAMWNSLATANCAGFNARADGFRVSYVFSVEGENPPLAPGVCKLQLAFAAGAFTIYRR